MHLTRSHNDRSTNNASGTTTRRWAAASRCGFRSCLARIGLALAGALSPLLHNAAAQTVDLGTAAPFGVLAGAGITVAGAVNSTTITGDIGSFPTASITGLNNVVLIGVNHAGDAVTQNAKGALLTAYNAAAARIPNVVFAPAANLGGLTLVSGVYRDPTSFGVTGTLTLNAAGNPNAVWIFQTGSTLTTASLSKVVLVGGAQACHVFWQVGSSATLGTSSLFSGTILALTDITLTTGAAVQGRLLALNGAVTLDTNNITVVQCADIGIGATDVTGDTGKTGGVTGVIQVALDGGLLTPNQSEVASALIRSLGGAQQSDVLDFLGGLKFVDLPGALDKIAPEELTSIYNLGFAQLDTEVFSLQQRLQDVRADEQEPPPERIPDGKTFDGKSFDGKSMANGKEASTPWMPRRDHWGFFVTETGEFASIGDTSNANGFNSKSEGTTLGIDRRLGDHVVLGITVGYTRTDSDLVDGGKLKGSGGKAALYAMYYQGGFYTEGMVGGGYDSYDTRRSALDGSAYGSADGEQFDAYWGIGYGVKMGPVTVTPIGSLLYTRVGINGFDERGSLLPLHIDAQHESSLRSCLGMRAAYTAKIGKARVTPSVSAQWQHEFLDNEFPLNASFEQGSDSHFTVYGPRVGRDSALLTAGINVAWSRYACYLAYQADLGVTNYESQMVLAGVRVTW